MIRITIEIDDNKIKVTNHTKDGEQKLVDTLHKIVKAPGKPKKAKQIDESLEKEKKFVKEIDTELEKKPGKKNNRMPKFKKICEVCDNQFQPMSGRQIYCSDECKKIGKKIKTTETEISKQKKSIPHIEIKEEEKQLKKCCICGTRFKPKTGNEECCSEKCDEENIKKQIAQGKKYNDQYFKNKPTGNDNN